MNQNQTNSFLDRWWLYLPRNLSKCCDDTEEVTKHVKRKTKILDQYIRLKPNFFLPTFSRRRGISADSDDLSFDEGDISDDEESEDENSNFVIRKRALNLNLASNADKVVQKSNLKPVGLRRGKSELSACGLSLETTFGEKAQTGHKMVRFADSLGLELENTRLILCSDLPPNITYAIKQAYDRANIKKSEKILAPNFNLTLENGTRKDVSASSYVYLNSFRIFDGDNCLIGEIRVRNLGFEKRVFVRYTLDDWISYRDVECNWNSPSFSKSATNVIVAKFDWDLFSFCIFVPMERFFAGRKLHFAICFQCCGEEYWDNNDLANYTVECFERPNSPWDRM